MNTKRLSLCEGELHEAAIRTTGLHDFGDPDYREGLGVLLRAFDTDIELAETVWKQVYDLVLRVLCARLHTQKGWSDHPEVLATRIRRPLIIVGLPRTGTTALHRLLSEDRQFQGLEAWLVDSPMIRPPRETWGSHPAYRACVSRLEAQYARIPQLRAAHEYTASEPEECGPVLMQSFVRIGWTLYLPSYTRWYQSQSELGSYRRYADVLRLVGAHDLHRTWLLKSPTHMTEIDTLLEVFPDACLIQTHRDPLEAIPSGCRLLHMLVRDFVGEAGRPEMVGPWLSTLWRTALDRIETARRRVPEQIMDVDQRQLRADPLGTISAIYKYFDVELSQDTAQRMHARLAQTQLPAHRPSQPARHSWGITSAQIREAFGEYRALHRFS